MRWLDGAGTDGAGPLRICGTPLGWLRAGGPWARAISGLPAICVVDWRAGAVSALRALGPAVTLVADDAAAAAALRELLKFDGLPGVEEAGRGIAQLRHRAEAAEAFLRQAEDERVLEDERRLRAGLDWPEMVE